MKASCFTRGGLARVYIQTASKRALLHQAAVARVSCQEGVRALRLLLCLLLVMSSTRLPNSSMDKVLQCIQLCLPCLVPEDVCILRCTCKELRDMRVSWKDHSIDFCLEGPQSCSALSWLHKNIGSMQCLSLKSHISLATELLQGLIASGR
jgi:hypothetical protein